MNCIFSISGVAPKRASILLQMNDLGEINRFMVDIKDICYVRAKLKNDYVVDGRAEKGYRNIIPYKDYNIVLRIIRECWFKAGLTKSIWFNPEIRTINSKNIIINDPLITSELISYVVKNHPDKNVFFVYENRVSTSLNPKEILEDSVIKVTYDESDSDAFDMHFIQGGYQDIYRISDVKRDIYDIVYVGRDKGRGDKLLGLEKQFRELGLKTYFHICGDRKWINKHKWYYKPLMDYTDYLNLIARSKAILNIMPNGQRSLTMRDYEVIFNGIKGITNNKWIQEFELYDPSRFFILGEDDINNLPHFLSSPFKKIKEESLYAYTEDNYLKNLIMLSKEVKDKHEC